MRLRVRSGGATNIAAQKNAASFAQFLSDLLLANNIELEDPDTYENWEAAREAWLESDAMISEINNPNGGFMSKSSRSLLEMESVSELNLELPLNIQLPITSEDYRRPTPDEVRGVLEDAGLTQADAAALLGVTERTMRDWLSRTSEQSAIPYPAWRAILFELRVLDVTQDAPAPACAKWWLVNGSVMADSMARGPYAAQRIIGPYTSYRTATNIAAQKNAASFAQFLSDLLLANNIELEDPDTYENWGAAREAWLESDAMIYDVQHSRDLERL